ncbi:hypothetical protein V5N11_020097 [Cardamine amara subsp. amara]|uniref:KRR-R motif-containing protein 1 n=1 Tax=Cardamine amara subsp. amara TaxID=228776 RepID=A0ABD1AT38_CARAN
MTSMAEVEQSEQNLENKVSKKNKNRKPKPWDDDPNIDDWKIEKFDPAWNPTGMLEVSSFSRYFPQHREKYLEESWPIVESALKQHGVSCMLNLVKGFMTVSTTKETRDPYIIVKARDLIRLLARSVPAPQAIKILEDEMLYDIINIKIFVRNKERFARRRDQLIGPNSYTLKELERLTNCYILVEGSTVAVMGSFKGIRPVRKTVEECMENILHPKCNIMILKMIKELEKDPALAIGNWDRFLPRFKRK